MHKIKQRRNEIIDGGVISLAVVFCRKPRYSISGSLKNGAEMPRFFVIKRNPPAMPVDKGKTTKALAAARSRYTKKLLCAKLNVRLATVHK